jgi:hypothetical protein
MKPFLHQVLTKPPRLFGGVHVRGRNRRVGVPARDMGGFADLVRDVAEARRKVVLVVHREGERTRSCGPPPMNRTAAFFPAGDSIDEPRVSLFGFGIAGHPRREVRLYLEQLLGIFVVGIEQIVERWAADQYHLDIQPHRLGIERDRTDQAELRA